MKILSFMKRNKLLFTVAFIYLLLFAIAPSKAITSADNTVYYIVEMIKIMPVIFIITALIETWVPTEVIMKNLGDGAGIKGGFFALLLGSFSAGPIYAAFPVCKTLIKKGANIFNVVIILGAWAVVKIPMLINESKFLGFKFMSVRWILTILSIFAMAYIMSVFVKKNDIPMENDSEKGLFVRKDFCIGCGLCAKLNQNVFKMIDGKAMVLEDISHKLDSEAIDTIIKKCPAKAIQK